MRRCSLAATVLITLMAPASAAEDGCGKFAWPLAREQALFASADKATIKAGETLTAIPKTAFVLQLKSSAEAAFAMSPERKPKLEHWFGGAIQFPALEKPGIAASSYFDIMTADSSLNPPGQLGEITTWYIYLTGAGYGTVSTGNSVFTIEDCVISGANQACNYSSPGTWAVAAVPLGPSTWPMLLIGFAGIGFAAYRRRLTTPLAG